MQLAHDTWLVVADGERFLLLRNIGDEAFLHLEVVEHEATLNPPARALATDRPGRHHDATRQTKRDVAAFGKSAMDETDWHSVAKERFAEHVADRLDEWAASGRFRDLVIVADPRSLGALRNAYGETLRSLIVAEIAKDLTNLPLDQIEASIKAFDPT